MLNSNQWSLLIQKSFTSSIKNNQTNNRNKDKN